MISKLSTVQIKETFNKAITPWSSEIEFTFLGMVLTCVGILFAAISIWKGFSYNIHTLVMAMLEKELIF